MCIYIYIHTYIHLRIYIYIYVYTCLAPDAFTLWITINSFDCVLNMLTCFAQHLIVQFMMFNTYLKSHNF